MAILGSIVGGALGVGSSIIGGISAARAAKKADKMLVQQKEKNQAWYDRNYNADYTQRSDAQALLGKTRDYLKDRYNQSAATSTVMGGTDEALAMQRGQANDTLADTVGNINAQADAYKSSVEQNYMNQDANLTQQQVANQQQKAANIAQAASGAGNVAAGIVGSIFDKK